MIRAGGSFQGDGSGNAVRPMPTNHKVVHQLLIESRQKEGEIRRFDRRAQTAGAARLVSCVKAPLATTDCLETHIAWYLRRACVSSGQDCGAHDEASTPPRAQVLLIWAILCNDVEEYEARQQGHDTAEQVVARQTGKIDQFKRKYGHHSHVGFGGFK